MQNSRIERDCGKAAAYGVLTEAVHPSRWAVEALPPSEREQEIPCKNTVSVS